MRQILEKFGTVEKKDFCHPTYHKLLGQGDKFREKNVPIVREHFFVLNKKRH
jgi:hypothetical protein